MPQLGVVLATFGSAVTAEDVPAYLASVRGGREVPEDLIEEFRRRYDLIGRSPLIDITQAQCAALQSLLDSESHDARHPRGRRDAALRAVADRRPRRARRRRDAPHHRDRAGSAVLTHHPGGLRADRRRVAR